MKSSKSMKGFGDFLFWAMKSFLENRGVEGSDFFVSDEALF
jgi:hypothetical protein